MDESDLDDINTAEMNRAWSWFNKNVQRFPDYRDGQEGYRRLFWACLKETRSSYNNVRKMLESISIFSNRRLEILNRTGD